jgi:formyltetrahydrofolate deformylase
VTAEPGAPVIATLLVRCPDRRGIVAALSQRLYELGANILDADQHSDDGTGGAADGLFFQRIRFDLTGTGIARPYLEGRVSDVADRFGMWWRLSYESEKKRVALFCSRADHCLYDLLLRHKAGELSCEVPLIVSNHQHLRPVAEHFGIPYHVFPITPETKRAQEDAELELLKEQGIDLVVLARYMQVLSPAFIAHHPARIINIHHSFLPAFQGGRPYHQAHERGVKLIGATAHYATDELDEGPIICQDVIHTSHRDDVSDLVRKGRDIERTVLARAVRAHLEDRILVCGNRTVVFD